MKSVYFSYNGGPSLLSGIDFTLGRNDRVAVLGKSGVGKTTFLKIIAGLLKPVRGEVVNNFSKVSYIPQNLGLVETATALENVMYASLDSLGLFLGVWKRQRREEALKCLSAVGISHLADAKVSSLSGGERQRVAIARALMQKADLILADEPVANLDLDTASSVLKTLTSLSDVAVVAVMHDVDLAMEYFQRGYKLEGGRLIQLW